MRLCVCWCFFLCGGHCAEFPHTGPSQSAFPKGETPATVAPSHNGPPPRPQCATSQDPEPTLSSCSSPTALRQTTSCISPDRPASRVDCSLSLLHHSVVLSPNHFGPEWSHTVRVSPRSVPPRTMPRSTSCIIALVLSPYTESWDTPKKVSVQVSTCATLPGSPLA